jgi:hypothetical protein
MCYRASITININTFEVCFGLRVAPRNRFVMQLAAIQDGFRNRFVQFFDSLQRKDSLIINSPPIVSLDQTHIFLLAAVISRDALTILSLRL